MPVGVLVGRAIAHAANGLSETNFKTAGTQLLDVVKSNDSVPQAYSFPHVRITAAAFPDETESAIARARAFIETIEDDPVRTLLNLACMTVLEAVSYTRKDGQYLRWDYRADRPLRSKVDKGPIQPFHQALGSRLFEMAQDIGPLRQEFAEGRRVPNRIQSRAAPGSAR